MKLTTNFSLEEFVESGTADRKEIDNTPPKLVVENLVFLAEKMEEVRNVLRNKPITITSGYRCVELNKEVGSGDSSLHVQGLACDFKCPSYGTPYEVATALKMYMDELGVDQLILEGRWVHVSFKRVHNRGQLFTAVFKKNEPTLYLEGLFT